MSPSQIKRHCELDGGGLFRLTSARANLSYSLSSKDFSRDESEIEEGQEIGEEIEVFLYRNRQGGVSATPMIPHILPSTYGWAKVLKISKREGAVLDIGTTREVYLLPADLPLSAACRVRVDPTLILLTPVRATNAIGFASLGLPWPATPAIAGLLALPGCGAKISMTIEPSCAELGTSDTRRLNTTTKMTKSFCFIFLPVLFICKKLR